MSVNNRVVMKETFLFSILTLFLIAEASAFVTELLVDTEKLDLDYSLACEQEKESSEDKSEEEKIPSDDLMLSDFVSSALNRLHYQDVFLSHISKEIHSPPPD